MSRLVQSGGVLIRRMNYRESSMIVDILTEAHGLVSFIVSGVRQKKPRMSPVLFTPGYIIDLVFYENAPGKLWRIKEASVRVRYEDRKSTRLNSSHVAISYAVFCLKKKKKVILSK